MPQVNLGPPLSGFRAFFDRANEGAWSVGKMYPNTGQVVLQMGVNGVQEHPEGIACAAGFRRDFIAERDGIHSFSVTVQAGPVTVLPRGAFTIFARVTAFVTGAKWSEPASWHFPTESNYVGAQFGVRTLAFSVELERKDNYTLTIQNSIYMDYPGVPNPAPYTEIIATYRSVVMVTPRILTEAPEAPADDRLERVLARTRRLEREFSDEEMAAPGGIELR